MERDKPLVVESDYVVFMNNFLSKELLFEDNNVSVFSNDFLGDYDYTKYQEED